MEKLEILEVLRPGILTTIQDLGRYGFSKFGVPPSGALDTFSHRVANLLVGNGEEEGTLEITIGGLKLKVLREVATAITGGNPLPTLNEEPLDMWRTHLLVEGDVIAFKTVQAGCRAYLAVSGGFVVPKIMGSKSTYLLGRFGGLEGRGLKRGDILYTSDVPTSLNKLGLRFSSDWIPSLDKRILLRVIPGPQDYHFTKNGLETFYSESYQVTPQCDRTGIRLEGSKIERRPDVEDSIISEGLVSGAIQVPGDGKPIIILTELVTGGYAKIATVISADLSKVAQLKSGDRVKFEPISIEMALSLLREMQEQLRDFKNFIHQ